MTSHQLEDTFHIASLQSDAIVAFTESRGAQCATTASMQETCSTKKSQQLPCDVWQTGVRDTMTANATSAHKDKRCHKPPWQKEQTTPTGRDYHTISLIPPCTYNTSPPWKLCSTNCREHCYATGSTTTTGSSDFFFVLIVKFSLFHGTGAGIWRTSDASSNPSSRQSRPSSSSCSAE